MPKYLLAVTLELGVVDVPMEEWKPGEINAHLDYYRAITDELVAAGKLVTTEVLAGPDLAKIVTAGEPKAPVVTDGPFQEFKEWLAGFQIVEVETEERALEIAARLSVAAGPGGVPLLQPIQPAGSCAGRCSSPGTAAGCACCAGRRAGAADRSASRRGRRSRRGGAPHQGPAGCLEAGSRGGGVAVTQPASSWKPRSTVNSTPPLGPSSTVNHAG
jgi:hypothetical protein